MLSSIRKLLESALLFLLGLSILVVFYRLLDYHYNLMLYPFLLEYVEGAQLLTTDLISKGGNPFSIANQPMYLNYYGFIYNVIAAVFLKLSFIFDNSAMRLTPMLLIHRFVSALGIFLSCLVVFAIMYRQKIKIIYIFSAIIILYASLLFSVTATSRPDSLGMFFFLMSICMAWRYDYSKRGLFLSFIFGILAFYTKQYFILGTFMVLTYVFLFISKKRAVTFTALFIFVFVTVAVIVNHFLEMFFYDTLLIQFGAGHYSIYFLKMQLRNFILHHSPGLAIIFAFILLYNSYNTIRNFISNNIIKTGNSDMFNVSSFQKPLFSKSCSLFTYCLIISVIVFVFLLGGHDGAYMTYIFQLLMPFIVIFIFNNFTFKKYSHFVFVPLIIMNLFTAYYFATHVWLMYDEENFLNKQYHRIKENPTWAFYNPYNRLPWRLSNYTARYYKNVLASPILSVSLIQGKKPVYDSGATSYASFIKKAFEKNLSLKYIFPLNCSEQIDNYLKSIDSQVEDKKFDVIIRDGAWSSSWIISDDKIKKAGYVNHGGPTLFMPHTGESIEMTVWKKPGIK